MINPTNKLIQLCNKYDAKLTILIEIGELWAFENEKNSNFNELLGYNAANLIKNQLISAVKAGHDVQLHIHPQWLKANWKNGYWSLDYSNYSLPLLSSNELSKFFFESKLYLEELLKPHCMNYSCIGFRSGNWNTQPSYNLLKAMKNSGLVSDTSVFKWGYKISPGVYYDYRCANSNIFPWFVDFVDINKVSSSGDILEVPIYCEYVNLFRIISFKRIKKALSFLKEDQVIFRENLKNSTVINYKKRKATDIFRIINFKHPKKLDYCKLSSSEMLKMAKNIFSKYYDKDVGFPIPIVMIGHSKELSSTKSIERFLRKLPGIFDDSLDFRTYKDYIECNLDAFKAKKNHAA
jgi:hypothetical protein